ncbi:MAG: sodium:solute symporter family protein [Cyanobacteria bacterium P01_A01_bin.114]
MQIIDWLIVLAYLIFTMALGVYLSRRASGSLVDFFVSGRSLPWWLAGTSMAATTFSIDTPLYIAGVVGTRGIAGNWEWWSFGIAHVVLIYVFARLWRRSEVVTDAELTELRYGGRPAAVLRGVKAFLFAVPINCIGISYAMLAMVGVVDALELLPSLGIDPNQGALLSLWEGVGIDPAQGTKLLIVAGVSVFVLIYSGFSGLWGVVATDFFQFFLALFGAVVVAIAAVSSVGGMQNLIIQSQTATEFDILSVVPLSFDQGIRWSSAAGISINTFLAAVFLQWWSFRRSDGGGEFIQRLISAKNEAEAEKSAWFFNILNYVVRTWPWIVVALAAVVIYPNLDNRTLGYPKLMLDFLPPVLLGIVVASLVAAFMSTVSTSINWGASFVTNDLYLRFLRPGATQPELVLVGRLSSVLVTALGALFAFWSDDVTMVFRLVIAIGTGAGLVLILRWFWWRINAAAELTAILGSFVVGSAVTFLAGKWSAAQGEWLYANTSAAFQSRIVEPLQDFGPRLTVITVIVSVLWIIVLLITPPESDDTLDNFYRQIRPGGPGWQRQRQRTGVRPLQNLGLDLQKTLAALLLLFGAMFAVGGFLLLQSLTGWLSLIISVLGGWWLRRLEKQPILPIPRPGLDDSDYDT